MDETRQKDEDIGIKIAWKLQGLPPNDFSKLAVVQGGLGVFSSQASSLYLNSLGFWIQKSLDFW